MVSTDASEKFSPPYLPFRTFRTFLDRAASAPLPPRIDRGFLSNMDGNSQSALLSALRSFRLIATDGTVLDSFKELVQADETTRKKILNTLLRDHFVEQVQLGVDNATSQQLEESFRSFGISGSTLRKAVTFYLHAAEFAELPKSPHFKAPKQESGPKRKPKPRKSTAAGSGGGKTPEQETPSDGDEHSVQLASGVTLKLAVSQRLMKLSKADRTIVLDLIDKLDEHAVPDSGDQSSDEEEWEDEED